MALPVWRGFSKFWRNFPDLSTHFGIFFEFWQHFAAELQKLHSFSHLQLTLK